jgi:hypothetical protein
MHNLRKLGLVTLVWLTAAAMLFAGVPYLACRCPESRQSVRPGSASCCCCAGAVSPGQKHSCCQQTESRAVPRTAVSSNQATCIKSFVPADAVCLSPVQNRSVVVSCLSLTAQIVPGSRLGSTESGSVFPTYAGCSPPADLVTLLQHLLI